MQAAAVVVEVEDLVKRFGDRMLFEKLSFSLPRNGIVGVLGPNGVGDANKNVWEAISDGEAFIRVGNVR